MSSSGYLLKHLATGQVTDLIAEETFLGRSEDNDIVLANGHPSRRHARLILQDGELVVEDLGSANGTFVNGDKLDSAAPRALREGDSIKFDIDEYRIEMVAPAIAEQADASEVEDSDRTMMRPAVTAESVATEKPPAPAAAVESPQPEPTEAPVVRPGAWADPDAASSMEGRTELLDSSKLKALMGSAGEGLDSLGNDVDRPALIITSGSLTGTLFPLDQGSVWLIGADPACEIVLEENNVSAKHAKLRHNNGRWQLADQMTVNGTFVNGKKSTMSYLDSGDRLTFGSVTAIFKTPGKGRKKRKRTDQSSSKSNGTLVLVGSFLITLLLAVGAYFLFLQD